MLILFHHSTPPTLFSLPLGERDESRPADYLQECYGHVTVACDLLRVCFGGLTFVLTGSRQTGGAFLAANVVFAALTSIQVLASA